MLKFLTHKLRTHSLNEDPNQEKTDDDHDSGTESDDEFQDGSAIINEPSSRMESPASPGATDSAVPSDTDFGGPTSAFGFLQREPSDDVDDEFDGCIQKTTSLSLPSSLSLLLSPSSSSTTTSAAMTKTTAAIATMCIQSCKSTDMLINYNDHHSSEEELEVINNPKIIPLQSCRPATAPEKRKWSQISSNNNNNNNGKSYCNQIQQHKIDQINQQILKNQQYNNDNFKIIGTCSAPPSRTGRDQNGSGSSDEEVHGLLGSTNGSLICQPVKFRTSPPIDAHKPGRSLSPPPKVFHVSTKDTRPPPRPRSRPRHNQHLYHHHHHHYHHHHHHHHRHDNDNDDDDDIDADIDTISACSPRKRPRPPHRQPRPCLDFEKMQQLKARAVTAWRHNGDHGNELSVFCW